MWLFTPHGFYSIVQKRGDSRLTIRSRDRRHLKDLQERYIRSLGPIRYTPDADYPYRATATKRAVAQALARLAQDVCYENFKDRASNPIGAFQGPRAHAVLHRVWSAVTELEPPALQNRRWRGLLGQPVGAESKDQITMRLAEKAGMPLSSIGYRDYCQRTDVCIRQRGHDGKCFPTTKGGRRG